MMLARTITGAGCSNGLKLMLMARQVRCTNTVTVRRARACRELILRVRADCKLGADAIEMSASRRRRPLRSRTRCMRVALAVVRNASSLSLPLGVDADSVRCTARMAGSFVMAQQCWASRVCPTGTRLATAVALISRVATHWTTRANGCPLL